MSDSIKSHCRICKHAANQEIVAKHDENGFDEKEALRWWDTFQILKCNGCDTVSFRSSHRDSESFNYESGRHEDSVQLFPSPGKMREPVQGLDSFPASTRKIYLETLTALSVNAPILAAIGIRAIIESVCKDLGTNGPNLEKKIDALAELGRLSRSQADMLHKHRFMGNVAAHEIQSPEPDHLLVALEIAETLLKTIYVLPAMAETLPGGRGPASTPPGT